jgi:hypothetical protein
MKYLTNGKLGFAVAVVLAASFSAPAAAQAPPPASKKASNKAEPQHLVVTDSHGRAFGPDPTLAAGTTIFVTVRGFAPSAPVEVRLVSQPALAYRPRADHDGVLRFLYRVPTDLSAGAHRLTFSGAGPSDPHSARPLGNMNIVVTVPNVAIVPFVVNSHGHL